ncbi:VWA domain-containing protein [Hymenobacter sp. HSC-4F20]|uniref:vWA domain-containing protein n=1 Tax=Hymenobacter sp. HSC-4F20 TaxID=2864135 RepID=UPI001C735222|nr:vWA domain-containing protein [Hymenobacter sp. HSC-4F20]MBX0291496.1 VWA domain-containing protein [Hymenobacter sp. HSC-4F20]
MSCVSFRAFLCGIILLLTTSAAHAQSPTPEAELNTFYDQLNAYRTTRYQPLPDLEALQLPSTFSGADLQALHLQDRHIVRVDLVYTAFRLNPAFNQRQLNLNRIRNLAAGVPGLLQDESVTWTLVEQTGCNSPAECQPFFHGFVVYVARHATTATSRADLDSLTRKLRILEKKRPKAAKKAPGKKVACNLPSSRFSNRQMARSLRRLYHCPQRDAQLVKFELTVDARGTIQTVKVLPPARPLCTTELEEAIRKSVVFNSGFPINRKMFPFIAKGVIRLPIGPFQLLGEADMGFTNFALPDSAARLYRVFLKKKNKQHKNDYCEARITKKGELLAASDTATETLLLPPDANVVTRVMQRHPEWNKEVVVTDATGSMFPYTYDLLAWLQLSALEDPKTFVFFNDGNDQPDKDKRVGETGGFHHVKTDSYEAVKNKLIETMKAGGGGDAPENDAEALLYAQQLAGPDASPDLILIADNYTFPRDAKLLKNTTAQVRIILCGVHDYINPKYLALARKHGFTLHTIEGDIENLSKLLEGETITIQGQQYQVTKDGFKLIQKT